VAQNMMCLDIFGVHLRQMCIWWLGEQFCKCQSTQVVQVSNSLGYQVLLAVNENNCGFVPFLLTIAAMFCLMYFYSLAIRGVEFRALHWLGRHFAT
jgi:hypothetical protein